MDEDITIDYCGELYHPLKEKPLTIGRDADIVLDNANPFLHRVFLEVEYSNHQWTLKNVGTNLSATIAIDDGVMRAWLAPGGIIPLSFNKVVVWFTAGETTYEFEIHQRNAIFESAEIRQDIAENGERTMDARSIPLTPDQKLLVVVLAEDVLRRGNREPGSIPTSARAADRLGWTITKFNRKLDNVCGKYAQMGVRGLHGGPGRLANSRKARLVEYTVSANIVTKEDLALLPAIRR